MVNSQKPLSDLAAITLARADELKQPKPNEAVIAACDLFMAEAVRQAAKYPDYMIKNQPPEDA